MLITGKRTVLQWSVFYWFKLPYRERGYVLFIIQSIMDVYKLLFVSLLSFINLKISSVELERNSSIFGKLFLPKVCV